MSVQASRQGLMYGFVGEWFITQVALVAAYRMLGDE